MRYADVADGIRSSVALGRYGTGGALPSEAELGAQFGVSRVTVRRALESLRSEGLVASRKGAGWFVAVDLVRQTLGRFTTVEAALADAGLQARRRVLQFRFEPATSDVAAALRLEEGAEVLLVRRLNLAGDDPFALVAVWVPGELGATLSRADVERATFYELLPLQGVRLAGATQTITAVAADAAEARLLGVAKGAPLLACRRLTSDEAGRAVVYSEHRYPGHRTAFEVELPRVSAAVGDGPPGLRVVGARRRVARPPHTTKPPPATARRRASR